MNRRPSTHAPEAPVLALSGKIAALAAERFPRATAPMSKSDRAQHWLGEYVNARNTLPHLKPSELLALIHEHDDQACGATFTRTIKRLAQEHLASSKPFVVEANDTPRQKVSANRKRITHATAPVPASEAQAAGAATSLTPDDANAPTLPGIDIQARLDSLRASNPTEEQ